MSGETLHEQEAQSKEWAIAKIERSLDRRLPRLLARGQRKLNRGQPFEVTFVPFTYIRIGSKWGHGSGINHGWFDALIEERLGPDFKSHTRFEPYPLGCAITTVSLRR